jgi:hypothetical protein
MSNPASQGWTGKDVDGAGIDMYPAPAEQMMKDIAAVVTNGKTQWASANGRISSIEGKLGQGPLGRPVAKQYNPTAKQIRDAVNEMLKQTQKLSDAGAKAVPMYVNADETGARYFKF